jgi:hypothetical protein
MLKIPVRPETALAAALIPCFWQARLQAGDLGSHIFNAWLAQLVTRGEAPGLTVVSQFTNVLFDWMLAALLPLGPAVAERFAVAVSAAVFIGGALAFVRAVAGRHGWEMLPFLLPLAYGWVFHIGFFNFYLGLGLSLWALAAAWNLAPRGLAAAVPLLALAYLAHALPVLWAIAVLAYVWAARRTRRTVALAGAGIAAVFLLRIVLGSLWTTGWMPLQAFMVTGLDQVWVFDVKYLWIMIALLVVAVPLAWRVWRSRKGVVIFHVVLLTAVGIALLPGSVLLPGYKHVLAFIAERMSLALGVCLCALLACAAMRRWERWVAVGAALLFFGFLYHDERALNAFEDRMEALIARLPANQRVIGGIDAPGLRINALSHMVDRICVARCYSYANYEPSTAQFRVRALAENPVVVARYSDSWQLQTGSYMVKQGDLPIYQVVIDESGKMGLRSLAAGYPSGMSYWDPL